MARFRRDVQIALRRALLLALVLAAGWTVVLAAPAAGRTQDDQTPPFDPGAFGVTLEQVAGGFEQPLQVADSRDGSGRLFVVEQPGRIRIVRDGEVAPEPFLDLTNVVEAGGSEQGLLSVAFHPDYATNGRFFVGYTAREDASDTIASYTVSADDPDRADPASGEVLLSIEDPYPNHNGGLVMFGPDGYLYAGFGDGGSGGDPEGNGQNRGTLLGSILRLDIDRVGTDTPYAIPEDNPFVDDPAARPEIWAYGLRNPWRFSFDRVTDDLWIGDVGQISTEEIDRQPAGSPGGLNFGWNTMEGSLCYADAGCDQHGLILPVAEYSHDSGCSVTGGFVARGEGAAALDGVYLYADYCSGLLWGLGQNSDGDWVSSAPVETGLNISSFGEDAGGVLYLTDLNGAFYRISAGSPGEQ